MSVFIGRNDLQHLETLFLESRIGRDDRCGRNHRLVPELEKVLDGQVDVPAIAYVLYRLLALVEQQKIVVVNRSRSFVHRWDHLLVESFGRGNDLAIAVLFPRKVFLQIIFCRPLVDWHQERVLLFLPDDYGYVRLDDNRVPRRIDLQRRGSAARKGLVQNYIVGNQGQYIRQVLA